MTNDSPQNPFYSLHQRSCHPNAPAGGGGPGNFTTAGPIQFSVLGSGSLPHPNSPAGRSLTPEEIRKPVLAERVQSVIKAYFLALRMAPAAVYQETGYQLGQILEGLLPGLLQMLAVLGISTVVGSGAGATIGFFFGGVGAAPGAVVGGELGLEAGTAILTWMGLGFLAVTIGQGLGELTTVLTGAIRRAWHAAEHGHPQFEIESAAQDLARAVGILFRLILQGIMAYVLKKGAVGSSSATLSTSQTILKGGTRVAADESIAQVSALLKKSKLPDGFVVWIEKNWGDLKRNPTLVNTKTTPAGRTGAVSTTETPSQLKRASSKAVEDADLLKDGDRVNVKKADKRQRPEPNGFDGPDGYKTHGIDANPLSSPVGKKMIDKLKEQGMTEDQALKKAREFIASGADMPRAIDIAPGDVLYKVVPEGQMPGKYSAYFGTEKDIASLKGLSYDQITDRLGIPLESQQTARFDVVKIVAEKPTTVFESTIARTTQNGYAQPGGDLQTIITNRGAFSDPVPTGLKLP